MSVRRSTRLDAPAAQWFSLSNRHGRAGGTALRPASPPEAAPEPLTAPTSPAFAEREDTVLGVYEQALRRLASRKGRARARREPESELM